jgi:DNA-binding MarR family transcriptional regulator
VQSLSRQGFTDLLHFRTTLREFLHWSEAQAQAVGLTPAQHQLLLAVAGHPDERGPTVGDVAGYLLLKHHSAGELTDRAVTRGLVRRVSDPTDRRIVRLRLTALGEQRLAALGESHREELRRLGPALARLVAGLHDAAEPSGSTAPL